MTTLLYVTQEAEQPVAQLEKRKKTAPRADAVVVLPSARQEMTPMLRFAIECGRIERALTIDELARMTGIRACTLRDYEAGRAFPRARDIATLQLHLETRLVP